MGLSRTVGSSVIVVLLGVILAAIFYPNPAPKSGKLSPSSSCPLGYISSSETGLPPGHPPVPGGDPVSIVFFNASMWTGNPEQPEATCLAILKNGRIGYVGNLKGAEALRPPSAPLVDLNGLFVVPGFIDSHVHFLTGGLSLSRVNLGSASTKAKVAELVKEAAEGLSEGEWVQGGQWDDTLWGGSLPDASWIDSVTPNNPVFLTRMDVHMALVNTAALRAVGITAETPDPPGGKIHRDANGEPTGILGELAMALVTGKIPALSQQALHKALQDASAAALSKGVTMVHDMGRPPFSELGSYSDLEDVYLTAANKGELPVRVYAFMPLVSWKRLAKRVEVQGRIHPGGRLWVGGVKEFFDGSLGSRTALMHEPYTDNPATKGVQVIETDVLKGMVREADAAGLQVAIHAIGDRATDEVLGIYSEIASERGPTAPKVARRHRIEHAQHVSGRNTTAAFSREGILAVPNPLHLRWDARTLVERLGLKRSGAERAFPLRSVIEDGARVSLASDWPVVPMDPLESIFAAVHRREHSPNAEVFGGEECISIEQALRAQTVEAAYASFSEKEVGSLRVGLRADFTVLSKSLLGENGIDELPEVLQTYVDGKCAFGCPPDL